MKIPHTVMSRRALLRAAAGAALLASRLPAAPGKKSATFQNPLFAGEHADPTILRVGDDFYATHSSYHFAPGLVVWHSRDLVNWTPISGGLSRTYGQVYASDLAEHKGHYYIYYPQDGRLSVVHAADPHGPWSEPVDLRVGGIDPGHVVGPDGTRYLHFAWGNVVQLSPDGLSVVGEPKKVYEGWQYPKEWQTEGFWLEGPKLTRRGDFYYLTCAEGGTAGPPTSHMAVVARSKSPLGPWENSPHNPLIHTYSADEAWWSVGHGTLVSTPDDRWYIVYHGYRNGLRTLGRQTLMEPVEWTPDGWPVAPLGAKRGGPMPAPLGIAQRPMIPLSDDFRAPNLKLTWSAWDEADMSRFGVGNGALTVRAKGASPGRSSPLTVIARDADYQVQVVATPQNGCGAALGLFYAPDHWLFAELKNGQVRVYEAKQTLAERAWPAGAAHLRIVNRHNSVEVLAGKNGRDWQSLVTGVDVSGFNHDALGGYQCVRPALAATGAGTVRFTDFRYQAQAA